MSDETSSLALRFSFTLSLFSGYCIEIPFPYRAFTFGSRLLGYRRWVRVFPGYPYIFIFIIDER